MCLRKLKYLEKLYFNTARGVYLNEIASILQNKPKLHKYLTYEILLKKIIFDILPQEVRKKYVCKIQINSDYSVRGRLPSVLDDFLFIKLGSEYYSCQDINCSMIDGWVIRNVARGTLTWGEEGARYYLGTYWPRSFIESYFIFQNLFCNRVIKQLFLNKKQIKILDIGSGTGGDLIGFLFALAEFYPLSKTIIYSTDGNKIFLMYQKRIMDRFFPNVKINYIINKNFVLEGNELTNFDIILSFKYMNEVYNIAENYTYEKFLHIYSKKLNNNGFLILADTTNKNEQRKIMEFFPIIMNREVNQFLKSVNNISILLPLSCAFFQKICNSDECFRQKVFYSSFSEVQEERSKLNYVVIGNKSIVEKILHGKEISYIYYIAGGIGRDNREKYCSNGNIIEEASDVTISDAFII